MSTTKLTNEELNQLVTLQNSWNELTRELGELHYQKKVIEADLQAVDSRLDEIYTERAAAATKLQEKYGAGTVNISTGEFFSDAPPT